MIERALIAVIGFFLVSRFLTEKLRLLPKWVDVLDMPIVLGIVVLGFLLRPTLGQWATDWERRVIRLVLLGLIAWAASTLVHLGQVLLPAALLFAIGFFGGPLLFLALSRWVTAPGEFAIGLRKLLVAVLWLNVVVVLLWDFPKFLALADPDRLSGTFGNNAYQFSALLAFASGMLLGLAEARAMPRLMVVGMQALIFVLYYLLQFRAGLPFFLVAMGTMLVALYGRRILRAVVLGGISLLISGVLIQQALEELVGQAQRRFTHVTSRAARGDLGYGDLLILLSQPGEYLQLAKFQAFPATLQMLWENPAALLVGVGPGNYVSRAYYTFSVEFTSAELKGKGVGGVVQQLFGISQPWRAEMSERYLGGLLRQAAFGSYLFANPYSSYLAPIAEIGLLGAIAVFGLYGFLVRRSFHLVRLAREHVPEMLPLALASLIGGVYVVGLGFVDNWWEVTRVVFPLWTLFWAANAGVEERLAMAAEMEAELEEAFQHAEQG